MRLTLMTLITVQCLTLLLGVWLIQRGQWKLGVAQLLLLGVQALVFGA